MMKECVVCNKEFPPYVPHAKFCSNTCRNTNVRNVRKLKADSLPKKKCLFCNKDVNRPSREYKYCSDKCHKAMNAKKASYREKKKVRENHAKKPPKYCKTCNVQLVTTVRNYHQLEFCLPCRKQNDREKQLKFNEENKERLTTYFKENHAKKMQDPEYKKQHNEKSRLRRLSEPKTFVDCLVCGKNFQRDRYNRNCSKECNKKWLEIKRKQPANLVRSRVAGQVRKALKYREQTKNNKTFTLLGYTKYELKDHLESLFDKPKWNGYQWVNGIVDFSWDNMGEWHLDHIRPVASFNFDSTEHPDFKKCWALNNLQPLWAADNIRKGDKWDGIINR